MLTESETINHLDKAVKTLIINIILIILKLIQYFYFNIRIVDIKFFIFTYFSSNYSLIRVLIINTFYNLSKSSFINQFNNLITITNMLSYSYKILSIFISYLVLVLPSYFTYCVYSFIHSHFYFFKFC
jgi:hypothetical protein